MSCVASSKEPVKLPRNVQPSRPIQLCVQNCDADRLEVGLGCQNPPDGGGYEPLPQIAS
jgi:hypothetical protein